jgi:Tol biopolymer transport system component/imidazolonepropionase-like amidohydrolase
MTVRFVFTAVVASVAISASLPARVAPAQNAPDSDLDIKITEGTAMSAVASPDRRSIAIDLLGALWVLPIGGGEARQITPDTIEAREPSWSPDSLSLAFQGYEDAWHIFTIKTDGTGLKALTTGPFDDHEPDWSRDGRRIAFSSDRYGGISSIWQVEVETEAVTQLSAFVADHPCWAPIDSDVIFLGYPAQAPNPGSPSVGTWVVGPGRPEQPLQLAPGVTPARNQCGNGRSIELPRQPNGTANSEDTFPFRAQRLSANQVLYTADGHIKVVSASGGSTTVIPFTATLKRPRSTYHRTHRELQPEAPQIALGIVHPAVSPDGTMVAFTALGDLWILPVGGEPVQLTNDPFVELDPAWSPDATRLAFACDRGGNMDLWVHDFRTRADTQLTAEKGPVSGPAWSPDGQEIAFLVNRHDLHMVNAATGAQRPFRTRTGAWTEIGRPTWSAGGTRVAVGALLPYAAPSGGGTNQLLVRSLDTASELAATLVVHHSAGNRVNNGPVWSPDGLRMAYVGEGRLWVIGVGSDGAPQGAPTPIADDLPDSPTWQGDSQHLVYLTPGGLRRVSTEDGKFEEIPVSLAWQPLAPDAVVVHAGTVFDGKSQELLRNVDIVIDRGRIRSVEPHRDDLHAGTVVDASTDTVMPGLIDMHAHVESGYGEALGRLWLSYGITTVRDPEASAYAGLEQRESYDAGRRIGPRVFLAGDPFGGLRGLSAGGLSITSEPQLELELERAARLNYDFLSTSARLPDMYLRRATEYGHANGLAVASLGLLPAAAFGVDGVEGLQDTGRRGTPTRVSGRNISYQDVIAVTAKSGLTLTPMIGAAVADFENGFTLKASRDPLLLSDPRLALLPVADAEGYRAQAALLRRMPSEQARVDVALRPLKATLAALVAAGGRVVAGSGAPAVPYGVGLHIELEQFVDAGLTPFQALRTATADAAEALGVGDALGTIDPGKRADLVMVGGDPLRDIRNARDVRAVIRGGRYYDLPALIKIER